MAVTTLDEWSISVTRTTYSISVLNHSSRLQQQWQPLQPALDTEIRPNQFTTILAKSGCKKRSKILDFLIPTLIFKKGSILFSRNTRCMLWKHPKRPSQNRHGPQSAHHLVPSRQPARASAPGCCLVPSPNLVRICTEMTGLDWDLRQIQSCSQEIVDAKPSASQKCSSHFAIDFPSNNSANTSLLPTGSSGKCVRLPGDEGSSRSSASTGPRPRLHGTP